jgi:hypothetical protein
MDDLFNNMFHGRGTDDFQRLKAHLTSLDPDAADFYQREFDEWME